VIAAPASAAPVPSIDAIFSRAQQAWRPPRRMHLSAWADEHFYLSPESSAEPGRWRTLPYQRAIMDAITDPMITQVTVMKSARVGYTKMINAAIGYYLHQDPCPIMVVQPTLEDAEGYSKEEIAPMLRDCAVLAEIAPDVKTRDSDNTILLKKFRGGGLLSMVGANSPRGFRRVSRKVVILDEPDGYKVSGAGVEGDQVQLAIRRSETYWDRKIIAGSTPTIAGASRIEALFYAGDQRRYYVPCPHCGFFQVLVFERLHWPKHRPDLAVYVCLECGVEIEHKHKRDMVHAGVWRPGPHAQFPNAPAPPPFTDHASFHIWSAYSFSPNATWPQIAREYVEAKRKGVESLKTVVNTLLGATWKDEGEAPEWDRLYQRRHSYALGTCPDGVLFLTAGVDVQKDRLIYEIVGWGRDKSSWSIEAAVLPGDTSDETDKGPWLKLEALLARRYAHASGSELAIGMLAVDSGYNTQIVYSWARRHPMSRVVAVRGVPTAHVLIGAPSAVDVTVSGRKLKRGYKVWPIATTLAKSELYGWLALQPPTSEAMTEGRPYPPGYCHFPEYGEEYFKQLTAEQLVTHRSTRGFSVSVWELLPGRENHFLDARVYARAAAAIVGLDRFRESDWVALERALGVDGLQGPRRNPGFLELPLEGATETEPAGSVVQMSAPVPRAAPWFAPRRGSWLRGIRP
jgi:phage terminase large subunit GpA-like protein